MNGAWPGRPLPVILQLGMMKMTCGEEAAGHQLEQSAGLGKVEGQGG